MQFAGGVRHDPKELAQRRIRVFDIPGRYVSPGRRSERSDRPVGPGSPQRIDALTSLLAGYNAGSHRYRYER